jgi:FAD/FMN-containing dehydrogenase
MLCTPHENTDYFRATIGGLGLTGVITWAEIQLKPIRNPYIDQEVIRYRNLDAFFGLAQESDQSHEYTVAWIDCLAKGNQLGRGLFIRGNHTETIHSRPPKAPSRRLTFPFDPPFALINSWTLKAFNTLYYRKQWSDRVHRPVHYEPFFYPLDAVYGWNRVYGSKGFFQYQCAVPTDAAHEAIRGILERIARAGTGSFLAVLKLFGDKPSPGLLSFPMPGATLALDFPNQGQKTLRLLDELDEVTRSVGGRLNPSKDARMYREDFQQNYPGWTDMAAYVDPNISSCFWQRVTAQS